MTTVCQICDYNINQSTRKLIACPYCGFDACKSCCETYVLGESTVKCMNSSCGREWTRQFIKSVFTATFINGKLKKHQEQLLFDNERALLPATQPLVERQIKIEEYEETIKKLYDKIRELNAKKREKQARLRRLQNRTEPLERAEFVRACPDEECRGFLSTQWKCGLCQKWACHECHEIKGLDRETVHECNPDNVATARLLANDTKPCPKCRTGIYKIDGCDQMWCTQCHTAFNWRTGRIESVVHNPHYFEWLRRNGGQVPRNPGDNPCRNELTHHTYTEIKHLLDHTSNRRNPLSKACDSMLNKIIRNTLHLRYYIIPSYSPGDRVRRNEEIRIRYLRNRITETEFKTILQRTQKKIDKYTEIHNVLDILLTTVTDIIFRFQQNLNQNTRNGKCDWNMAILEEIDPIVDYSNECLREISKTYSSKLIQFSNEISTKDKNYR